MIISISGRALSTRCAATVTTLAVGLICALPSGTSAQETITYYHQDGIGSVRLTTHASGNPLDFYDYLPFGEPWQHPTVPDRRGFTGAEKDSETTFNYMGARYLANLQGRFTSPDPVVPIEDALVDPQRWNRYTYVMNRPLALTDPDGRCPSCLMMLQRLAQLASQAASRYGTAAHNWATRFFNSPAGQDVTGMAAEVMTGAQLPYGFSNVGQVEAFGRALNAGLKDAAGDGVQAFLAGSAVTGVNRVTGAGFDVGRTSDFDIALVGPELLAKAKELGLELRGKGTRTGPLKAEDLKALGFDKLADRLSLMMGRNVHFMIYGSEEALRLRGTDYFGF